MSKHLFAVSRDSDDDRPDRRACDYPIRSLGTVRAMSGAKRPRPEEETIESLVSDIDRIDAERRALLARRTVLWDRLGVLRGEMMRSFAVWRTAQAAAVPAHGQIATRTEVMMRTPMLAACNFLRDLCRIAAEFAEPVCASALPHDAKLHALGTSTLRCFACEGSICSSACIAPRITQTAFLECPHVICQRCRARAAPKTFDVCYGRPSRACACSTGGFRECRRCTDNEWVCGKCGLLHSGPPCAMCRVKRE